MTAMLPAHLTESLNSLGDAAAALTAEVRQDREQRAAVEAAERGRRRRAERWVTGLLVVALLMLGGLVTLVLQFEHDRRDRSAASAENLRRIEAINERIADCTTAGGDCYEQGQARTGAILVEVTRIQILVDLCGRVADNDTLAEMEKCVATQAARAR